MSEGGIGCDTNTIFSAHVSKTGCPIFMMNDNALTSCCGLSYFTSSRTTIRFSGSWAISTIWLVIRDFLTAEALGCWLRGFPGSTYLVTNDQASARFHASLGIVVQLVLPGVHLSWTNIEAWFPFAFLTKLRIYHNKRLGVFAEAHEGQAVVEAHFFLFLRHV